MQKIRYGILLMLGLVFVFSLANGTANAQNRRLKNTGILTVTTAPVAYSVKVNGQFLGMSGVDTPAEFYLTPGTHRLEVEFPNGKAFVKDIEIRRDAKNCICLRYVEETITRPCPYDIRVDGPDRVVEGDLITFVAQNAVSDSPNPLRYVWRVLPGNARITSGLGTSAITVDTTGLGEQTIQAEVDVNDGFNDEKCRQSKFVSTIVERLKVPPPEKFDEFEALSFDDDKARLDNFVITLQNRPDSQGYIIMYQGTDRNSMRTRNIETLSQKTLDYLVRTRGLDPRRIVIIRGGNRLRTTYDLWIVPPGANPPVPN